MRSRGSAPPRKGWPLWSGGRFDLVLMDIALPGMDGKEATRRIRAEPRFARLPVIAVTAHASKRETEEILAAGVTSVVTKPVEHAD